eukprot:TRINITY_DN20768_c0_g1_i1.p2 TRINITY_DN20768_c0_g1~~TRINITY_DN20768_c0_g1_i1.p2  ORF type:complete len:227 (+),score=35.33 TRINITY_DN20768_c0_g1_i1:81-761(+)
MADQDQVNVVKVFVGGLPASCDNEKLHETFSRFGSIKEAVVMMDQSTGRHRGFGYVTFHDSSSVEAAMTNYSENRIDNKWIEVKRCIPQEHMKGQKSGGGRGGGNRGPPQNQNNNGGGAAMTAQSAYGAQYGQYGGACAAAYGQYPQYPGYAGYANAYGGAAAAAYGAYPGYAGGCYGGYGCGGAMPAAYAGQAANPYGSYGQTAQVNPYAGQQPQAGGNYRQAPY